MIDLYICMIYRIYRWVGMIYRHVCMYILPLPAPPAPSCPLFHPSSQAQGKAPVLHHLHLCRGAAGISPSWQTPKSPKRLLWNINESPISNLTDGKVTKMLVCKTKIQNNSPIWQSCRKGNVCLTEGRGSASKGNHLDTTVMPREPIPQQIQIPSCPAGGEELRGSSLEALIANIPSEGGTCEELLPRQGCHTRSGAWAPNPRMVHPPGAPSVHGSDRQEVGWKVFYKRTPGKREMDILGGKDTFQLHFISITTTSSHSRIPTSPILGALIQTWHLVAAQGLKNLLLT